MKVQITRSFGVFGGPALQPGDVLDPPVDIALRWISEGLAKPHAQTAEHTSLPNGEPSSLPVVPKRKRTR